MLGVVYERLPPPSHTTLPEPSILTNLKLIVEPCGLRNALERALILGRGATIDLEHLPPELGEARPSRPGTAARSTATRGDGATSLDAMEIAHIRRVLAEVGGNRTRAAERLGISRSTLKRKLAQMRGP